MIALFDASWFWSVETSSEAISTMVQSFFQFSREVDEGEIISVKFSSTGGGSDKKEGHNRKVSRLRTTTPTKTPVVKQTFEQMEMLNKRNDTIICVLFHEISTGSDNQSHTLLSNTLEAFTKQVM